VADQRLSAALLELLPLAAIRLAVQRQQDLPPGRCLACKDRRELVCDPDPYAPANQRRPLVTAADVERCQCGFEPTYIKIGYQDPVSGERWTTSDMVERVDQDRAEIEEFGLDALVERERRRVAQWQAAHRQT